MQDQAKKLAEEHWSYVGEVVEWGKFGLANLGAENITKFIEFVYKSAFIHGFKHGVEALQNRGGLTIKEYEEIIAEYGEPGNYE
jgi:hypothetical protein